MKNKYYRQSAKPRVPLWIGGAVAVVLAGIVGYGLFGAKSPSPGRAGEKIGGPAPASVTRAITGVSAPVWEPLGTHGAVAAQLVGTAPHGGKSTFLYIGAEGCPYCAAERWAMVVALSRFGRFSGLRLMRSAPNDAYPDTPTLSFYGSHYRSPYVRAELVEEAGRTLTSHGFGPPLMKPTAAEASLMTRYDRPPYVPSAQYSMAIPFVLVGGRYLWIGSAVPSGLLHGTPTATDPYGPALSWGAAASAINRGRGTLGKTVLVNANALTAAICASDGERPANVCRAAGSVPARVVR